MKYLNLTVTRFVALLAALIGPALAQAAAGPYDAVTDAVDWATAITALGVVAAALALALVAKKGFKIVLGMIR